MKDITLVVTSCGRFDLLAQTLNSFYKFNTYPIREVIVTEDWNREGQAKSIDRAYSRITTPWIFHLEEDWEFYKSGFIEKSLEILETHSNISTVVLREHNDTNGQSIVKLNEFSCETMLDGWRQYWGGFTWNPGLRRLSDYKLINSSYEQYHHEHVVSQTYRELGFHVGITPEGYVRHIGWGRGLPKN